MSKEKSYKDDSAMSRNSKKVTTSKIWLAITGIIFVLVVIFSMYSITHSESVFDTTVYVTAITVAGGIFGSNLVWYSKKSASENHYKLRMSMYEDVVNQRLYFNEEMLKLKQKYNITDEEISELDISGDIDEIMDDELTNMKSKMDQDQSDVESPNEMHNFNM